MMLEHNENFNYIEYNITSLKYKHICKNNPLYKIICILLPKTKKFGCMGGET